MSDDLQIAIAGNMVALAKKKKANSRSKMLKMIMPMLSHTNGEDLAIAIANKNIGKFKSVWERIKSELVKKMEHSFKSHSSGFDLDEFYNDMLESLASDHNLLTGSGEIKDELRTLLLEGIVQLTKNLSLRVLAIDTASRGAKMGSVTYKIRTEIYNSEDGNVIKTFAGVGKLTEQLFDQLMLAKAYI